MIVDYHMHLRDAEGRIAHRAEAVEPYVERAAALGVSEIGFSEHVYYFRQTRSLWSEPHQVERCKYDLEAYVDAVVAAKEHGLPVKLGLEVDYVPGREEETRELLQPYPWDYLLGSIHFLDGLALDAEPSLVGALGAEAAWLRYFETLAAAARSGLFDVLAHPDLVKFFGDRVEWDPAPFVASLDGVCLEISTAGLYKPHGRLYPEAELLRASREAGVGITLASDAHEPAHVGREIGRAVEHARAAGYETLMVFESRVGREEPLG